MITPAPLQPGDTIAVVAPASALYEAELQHALAYFRARGYHIRLGSSLFARHRYLAGTDAARAADLMQAFRDPEVRAIFAARGGYGCMRLLDRLDYAAIAAAAKIFIGFSDTTALQLALLAKAKLVTFSGLTLCADFRQPQLDPGIEASLWQVLSGQPLRLDGLQPLKPGAAAGPLVGGCLSLITALVGTPFMPELRGTILVLEDTREEPYRLDRMLTQLRLAGIAQTVAAIVFGRFHACAAAAASDGSTAEVLADFAAQVACPVYSELSYGHGPSRNVLPIGRYARLSSDGTLQIDGATTAASGGWG